MRTVARFVMVVVVVLGLIASHELGLIDLFAEPARAKATIVGLGAWSYIAFVVAYALLQPFGVPGTAFVLAAPLLWPWPIAFVVSMIGTLAASAVGFSFARFVARDWVTKRVPARFRAYESLLARRPFVTVASLRLVFTMQPMLHAFFGVSRVSIWTHLVASATGYFAPLLFLSYFGDDALALLRAVPTPVWIGVVAVVLAVVAVRYLVRRACRTDRLGAPNGSEPDMDHAKSEAAS